MSFKGVSLRRTGDIIKVKLMDNTYTVYFTGKANINNSKEMEELRNQLRHKGVPL